MDPSSSSSHPGGEIITECVFESNLSTRHSDRHQDEEERSHVRDPRRGVRDDYRGAEDSKQVNPEETSQGPPESRLVDRRISFIGR